MSQENVEIVRPFFLAQLSDPHIGAEWADGDPVAGLAAAGTRSLLVPKPGERRRKDEISPAASDRRSG